MTQRPPGIMPLVLLAVVASAGGVLFAGVLMALDGFGPGESGFWPVLGGIAIVFAVSDVFFLLRARRRLMASTARETEIA